MSTPFYDLASLVVVPSGYKASKVYAQKPLTTDGQLTFSRASTATRVNSAGLIETVSSNVPRLDYLGSTCPKLLLEPQRTNALTYSEDFSNAAYTKGQSSITSNAAIAPDGTMSADKLVEDTSNNPHVIYRSPGGAGDTLSFFAKAAERNWVGVLSNNGNISFFNIANGTLGTIAASSTATITPYGNGWYRCTLYNTHGSFGMSIYLATANGTDTYTGDGTSGAFIWGAQLEESAAYATSYIPTTTAAVTRLADVCLSATASSLFNSPSGVFYWEGNFDSNSTPPGGICVSGSFGNRVQMYNSGADVYAIVDVASNNVFSANTTGVNITQNHKYAVSWSLNDFTFYVDGVQVASDTSGATFPSSTLNQFRFSDQSTNYFYANVKKVIVFPTRLTNAQLAELTAL